MTDPTATPPPPDEERRGQGGTPPPPPGANPPPGGYPPPPPGGSSPGGPAQPPGGYPPPPPPSGGYPPPPPSGGYPPPPPSGGYPPPPPPGGGAGWPGGGPAPYGRPVFSATDAVSYGWNAFRANIGPLITIALVIFAVQVVVGWSQWIFERSAFMSAVLSFVSLFVSLVISLGLIRAALIILDGRQPRVEDVLSTKDLLPYLAASLLVWITVGVGLVLCIIPGLIAGFLLQFYGYAIVDGKTGGPTPQTDPIGAMRTSYNTVSQNVGDLILLAVLCIVLNIAGALLCGVGLLVSVPVTALAIAYGWRFFSGGRIAPQPA